MFIFHLTRNRVIAAVRTNGKIRLWILVFAISCSTFKMPKTFIIIRAVSFPYSTFAFTLRQTTRPRLCIGGSCPMTSNWIFYKESKFEILQMYRVHIYSNCFKLRFKKSVVLIFIFRQKKLSFFCYNLTVCMYIVHALSQIFATCILYTRFLAWNHFGNHKVII